MSSASIKTDVLILGHGLAGASLALQFAMSGRSVSVVSDPTKDCASQVAIGLLNPVTGRRMARTWNFDEVFEFTFAFYNRAYTFLNKGESGSFVKKKAIFKALHTIEESNFFSGKSASMGYDHLLDLGNFKSELPPVFENLINWCKINEGGRMDPKPFLDASKTYFKSVGRWFESPFQKEDLLPLPDKGWRFKNLEAKQIVSCLGLGCPWKGGDLWAVKGQIYELEGLPDWGESILKTEKFLIPEKQGLVLAGSTYEREFTHNLPDANGYQEITRDLTEEFKQKARVTNAWAGIRPTTKDRKPIITRIEPGLFALNGLGAKGASLAPWAGNQLITLMEQESEH